MCLGWTPRGRTESVWSISIYLLKLWWDGSKSLVAPSVDLTLPVCMPHTALQLSYSFGNSSTGRRDCCWTSCFAFTPRSPLASHCCLLCVFISKRAHPCCTGSLSLPFLSYTSSLRTLLTQYFTPFDCFNTAIIVADQSVTLLITPLAQNLLLNTKRCIKKKHLNFKLAWVLP